jgi:predicted amidophosphoribosyltransferase
MKEDITSKLSQCPSCGQYFEPIDKEAVCEVCTPPFWHHPFQPDRSDVGDLGDCVDE